MMKRTWVQDRRGDVRCLVFPFDAVVDDDGGGGVVCNGATGGTGGCAGCTYIAWVSVKNRSRYLYTKYWKHYLCTF